MKTIEKKCWQPYFSEIQRGTKNFDVRLNDFDVQIGDIIRFYEYNPRTGSTQEWFVDKKVKYLLPIKLDSDKDENKVWAIFGENKDEFWQSSQLKQHGLIIIGF